MGDSHGGVIMASRNVPLRPVLARPSTADQGRTPTRSSVGVDHRVEPLAALWRSLGEASGTASPSDALRLDGVDVGVHDLAHEGGLERVDGVLAHDVEAPSGDLLGEDRAFQDQHADQVGERRGDEQGQQAVRSWVSSKAKMMAVNGERVTPAEGRRPSR